MLKVSPPRPSQRSSRSNWRVAIIDSGLDPRPGIAPYASRRFVDDGERVAEREPTADATGHGTAIAEIIASSAGLRVELLIAQVMQDHVATTPAAVAEAIHWCVGNGANLIHLSLGVANDRPALAGAVKAANASGALVVASTPARGTPSFPAAYPGVLRATGDARCAVDEISLLEQAPLTMGACAVFAAPTGRLMRGASVGAAHLTRFIVAKLTPGVGSASPGELLPAHAVYRGRERRVGAAEIVNQRTNSTRLSGS